MGEKAHLPEENGPDKVKLDHSDGEMLSDEDLDDLDDMSPEEFQMLDSQLDALNSALDDIEQKNDNIHTQLVALLQSNREMRKQIQEANANANANKDANNEAQ